MAERVLSNVTKSISVLKANINFKTDIVELKIKEKLSWTNSDESKGSSFTIGIIEVLVSDACPDLRILLENYIGTDPVFTSVDETE
jgi:hypothetical protein